jgi:hypothetical protein
VKLTRCKWWGVSLGWAVNQIIEEDTPFTFQNIQWLSEIQGNPQTVTTPQPYAPPNIPPIA